ncbi:SRPBCC domain-containing protein [Neotabrizicola sp. sgz301269]|uniref:SRPBCC domain-containing protein n=1 Tax=Neotabrizicola sp. sgz301269 TaxID=3276282 RepID=UPI00376F6E67
MSRTVLATEGTRSLSFTRRFAHPPARVLRAHLDAATLRRWIGSDAHPMTECQVDGRAGGSFRYDWTGVNGFSASGTFEEITARRIVHVERFDPDWTGGEARVITDFDDDGAGGTILRMQVIYASPEARESVGASGMAEGMEGAFDRLEALL